MADDLKRKMDRDAAEREMAEDQAWLKAAEQARADGYASKGSVDAFLSDFDGEAKE